MEDGPEIIGSEDPILITGAAGFMGLRLVENLIERGFHNLRCFVRSSSLVEKLDTIAARNPGQSVKIITGNLLSRSDCATATRDVAVIFHLAAGTGEKSFPDAFMNSVVATRNLLEAALKSKCLRRFVNVSSFTVYTNEKKPGGRLLDESCPVEERPELRGDAYCFAKVKQDELVSEYCKQFGIPYVIIRPGAVYGPGMKQITGRVGLGTFGVFLHLGGSNRIPFTYVDNCADAIALAGLKRGVDGEVFNIVDDELPSSRRFLKLYKQNVRPFRSIYVPRVVSYLLCVAWEKYAIWSEGQVPPAFNRKRWHVEWKKTNYSNEKVKAQLGWAPRVSMTDGLRRFFEGSREKGHNA
jgi:nucleoside-diphosphate-sugar epimerase